MGTAAGLPRKVYRRMSSAAHWRCEGFLVTRKFRGATYHIRVSNPDGIIKGVRSVVVDGAPYEGAVLPFFEDGKVNEVDVILGKRAH